jgi:hypothetical protein
LIPSGWNRGGKFKFAPVDVETLHPLTHDRKDELFYLRQVNAFNLLDINQVFPSRAIGW